MSAFAVGDGETLEAVKGKPQAGVLSAKSRFEFVSFNLDAEGVLGNEDGIWCFTQITLRPVVTILNEADRNLITRLLEKAEKSCLIARSLKCEVVTFPAVKIEQDLTVPARV